jgi:hypothetical protein
LGRVLWRTLLMLSVRRGGHWKQDWIGRR